MKGLRRRKRLSVSEGNVSLISQLTWVSGLELMSTFPSTTIVEKRSLESLSDPKFNRKTRLMIKTRHFHTPLKRGADGGLLTSAEAWLLLRLFLFLRVVS